MSPPHPLLLDLPDAVETERLLLRCPMPGDGAAVNIGIHETWETLRAWMPWARELPTPEASELRQRQCRVDFLARVSFDFNIFLRESGDFVGKIGLVRIDWETPKAEIGYWVCSRYQGNGYITEAAGALTTWGFDFLRLARLEIRCDPRNQRSVAVAERLGYVIEGHLRQDTRDGKGILRDTLIYARLASSENSSLPTTETI
jgi:RimJ/RimL family protein N-acetyltransferase